jgi:hypothetical protein
MNNYILILLSIVVLGIVVYLFFLNKQIMQLTLDVKSNTYDVDALREIVASKNMGINNQRQNQRQNNIVNESIKQFSQRGLNEEDEDTEIVLESDNEDKIQNQVEILDDKNDDTEDDTDDDFVEDDEEDTDDDESSSEEENEDTDDDDDENSVSKKESSSEDDDDKVIEMFEKNNDDISSIESNSDGDDSDLDEEMEREIAKMEKELEGIEISDNLKTINLDNNKIEDEKEDSDPMDEISELMLKNIQIGNKIKPAAKPVNKRVAPTKPAKKFPLGEVIQSENDNKLYIVIEDKNKVKRWKLVQ